MKYVYSILNNTTKSRLFWISIILSTFFWGMAITFGVSWIFDYNNITMYTLPTSLKTSFAYLYAFLIWAPCLITILLYPRLKQYSIHEWWLVAVPALVHIPILFTLLFIEQSDLYNLLAQYIGTQLLFFAFVPAMFITQFLHIQIITASPLHFSWIWLIVIPLLAYVPKCNGKTRLVFLCIFLFLSFGTMAGCTQFISQF